VPWLLHDVGDDRAPGQNELVVRGRWLLLGLLEPCRKALFMGELEFDAREPGL
jgi:hypothetical protein